MKSETVTCRICKNSVLMLIKILSVLADPRCKSGPVILQGLKIKLCQWEDVTQGCRLPRGNGHGKGRWNAQRGTISDADIRIVIVVGMSPGRRHVPKPVCDITSALRQQGIEYSISTLVLNAGSGVPPDAQISAVLSSGQYFGINEKEIRQIEKT